VFTKLNGIVALREALEWGIFRGEGMEKDCNTFVRLGKNERYEPLPTLSGAPELNKIFSEGVIALQECAPFERALAFFLFGALQQFFFDGNKRTSRFMMNGVLMSHGIDAISVPAHTADEFNAKMIHFYRSKDATEMMEFLMKCYSDAQ
jgi:hypothetical protein